MTIARRILIALIALVAAWGVVSRVTPASSAAPPQTFSLTLAGTDAHALDPHLLEQFVAGGGVGVVADDTLKAAPYIELGLDLPVGAKVTSIAVSYRYCESDPADTAVFGSYSPSTRVTQQVRTLKLGTNRCSPTTATTTGNPIATVAAGRRYVIDFGAPRRDIYGAPDPSVVLYGATLKYTCASPCVP